MVEEIIKELAELKKLINEQKIMLKQVLTFSETADYLQLSHSYLYHLASKGILPSYKPNGKKLYFSRQELDQWLLKNKQHSNEEVKKMANDYIINGRRA